MGFSEERHRSRPTKIEDIEMENELSTEQRDELLAALKARFDANKGRHPGLVWAKVQARLEAKPDKL